TPEQVIGEFTSQNGNPVTHQLESPSSMDVCAVNQPGRPVEPGPFRVDLQTPAAFLANRH
ncbi:MAG: hypothetical protein JW829_09095, partial [Pirellulales bacterium]|nr:hypothetical protein [Pirellulales bacterium]